MLGNFLLVITSLAYIGLAVFNLQKINATGERLMGWAFIAFGLIAIYVISSLFLTISIASKGGFNWLSSSTAARNLLVGILWFGMIAGVAYSTMLSTEMQHDRTIGIARLLSRPVYYGNLWLPLLMLIPYTILLNPAWCDSVPAGVYKIPLVLACVLGFLIMMAPRIVNSLGITVPTASRDELFMEEWTKTLQQETSTEVLFNYTKNEDERIRTMVVDKLRSLPDWEDELIGILGKTGEYGHHDFRWVYVFLDNYKVDHPDRFIEPVNNTLPAITAEVGRVRQKSFLYTGDLLVLNIDCVCRVLDKQFKDNSAVFRPNMLKLKEALEIPYAQDSTMTEDFATMLNTYKASVNTWLESN
jgi:hypothetical protein